MGNLPVVDAPPPSPHARTHSPAAELGGAVHVSPAAEDQGPHQALSKAHQDVVLEGDPGHSLPRACVLDALQVCLLQAQVWEWRHGGPPGDGLQHTEGDLVFVYVGSIGVGVWVEADGLLLGCGRGWIEVVARRGVALDVCVLDQRGNLRRPGVVHGGRVDGRVDGPRVMQTAAGAMQSPAAKGRD
jgi:hypothetical protein